MMCKYKIVFTNCGIRNEGVLGPMLGAVVRRVEVSKCKGERALLYFSSPSLSQRPLDQRSIDVKTSYLSLWPG